MESLWSIHDCFQATELPDEFFQNLIRRANSLIAQTVWIRLPSDFL
jgi:hypothetical protein